MLFYIALAFILFLVHQFWWRRRGLPPGPLPLPLIGNLHQFTLAKRWEDKFVEFKNRFGPIYTLYMGPVPVVTVNDYETCVKLFVNEPDTYSDRPTVEHFNLLTRGGTRGIVQSNGSHWLAQRRTALRILRDFGLGKNQMQERILDEVQTVCDILNKEIGEGIRDHNVNQYTDISVGSVINSLICGYRFTKNDKSDEFEHLKYWSNQFIRQFTNPLTNIGVNNAFLARMPLIRTKMLQFKEVFDQLFSFVDRVIKDHKAKNDYENDEFEPVDFVDAYMLEMYKARRTGNDEYFSEEECRNIVLDLWLAGQESTSTTLQWAFAYLVLNPDKQAKIHAELDREIGSDRLILVADRPKLVYLNAAINEVQRCANLAVFNAPHALAKDVTVNGYHLKKRTVIFPQISAIMMDPKNFPDPHKFQPERFIDSKGQLSNIEKLIPFEGLARMELLLFMANLLNQYKFLPGRQPPTAERVVNGGTALCKPYTCQLEKRF
ncbi:(pine wood nematode) hypothetical protein [Aphelenchoides bicaudatus]|nr:(pine wood nematode) hypothetical protein [Aphelenchoides bicaudatus]